MRAYEAGSAAYFATPPVNLIYAFNASLTAITQKSPSLADRFRLHKEASARIKSAAEEVGFRQLAVDAAHAANGMTALYFPDGLVASDLLPRLAKRDIVVAGGLHKDYKGACCRSPGPLPRPALTKVCLHHQRSTSVSGTFILPTFD